MLTLKGVLSRIDLQPSALKDEQVQFSYPTIEQIPMPTIEGRRRFLSSLKRICKRIMSTRQRFTEITATEALKAEILKIAGDNDKYKGIYEAKAFAFYQAVVNDAVSKAGYSWQIAF